MPTPTKQAAAPSPPEPVYPTIEGFIEKASPQDIAQLFVPLKEGLAALKGPKVEQSKKISLALTRTEELLAHLVEVREKLLAESKGRK